MVGLDSDPPNHPFYIIGFSILFTIHVAVPPFKETRIYRLVFFLDKKNPGESRFLTFFYFGWWFG